MLGLLMFLLNITWILFYITKYVENSKGLESFKSDAQKNNPFSNIDSVPVRSFNDFRQM